MKNLRNKAALFASSFCALTLLALPASAGLGKYSFSGSGGGTDLVKTNTTATTKTIDSVLIQYDATTTNTISIIRRYGSTDYMVQSETGTTVTNDVLTPSVTLRWKPNEVLVFRTSSDTNATLLLQFTED